ncbi:DUF4286 family protein [Bradyrhizobium sp. Ec3.3]|uniref:DUF4286 family protein n=1 Tax=Bradyrhizobium sp. Ec3.3 TaxID=189753 RepID=UPI000482B1F6|nr:DUF4286 family protein [Bradyrhizobium sp. Ec3.3]
MPIQSRFVLIASMDVDPAHEDLFNEVYDGEHVPHLLKVPGVHSVTRVKGVPFAFAIANGIKDMPAPEPVYTAIYEIDHPDVLKSAEWAKAVEAGRWASEVRPNTRNRHHAVYERQSTSP